MIDHFDGTFSQTKHNHEDLTLTFKGSVIFNRPKPHDVPVENKGRYGCSCWWIPFGDWGIKIFNSKSFVAKEDAVVRLRSWKNRFEELREQVGAAIVMGHIPVVHDYGIVSHTGPFERGGSVRTKGSNILAYYPAVYMKTYQLLSTQEYDSAGTKLRMANLLRAFEKDSFNLHPKDTLRQQHIGINPLGGSFVLLDIVDADTMKWL